MGENEAGAVDTNAVDAESAGPIDVVPLAHGYDAETLQDAVLLLSAMGIPHEIVAIEVGVALVVPAAYAERARREMAGMAADRDAEPPPPVLRGGAWAGIPTAFALVAAHGLLGLLPQSTRTAIYAAGELDAERVRHGELFRAITALTLHADPAHVVGNAIATAIFVSAAGDWIGPGLALLCTIVAGAVGNLIAAEIDPGHLSIGFSTATFGALGLSAVLGFVARYEDRIARRRAWLTLGAGVALLAMLGAGERSDLLAHILGLVAGAGIGIVLAGPGRLMRAREARPPIQVGVVGQLLATIVAIALVADAWRWALPHWPR